MSPELMNNYEQPCKEEGEKEKKTCEELLMVNAVSDADCHTDERDDK